MEKLCLGEDEWGEGRIRTKKNWSMVKWFEFKRREVVLQWQDNGLEMKIGVQEYF